MAKDKLSRYNGELSAAQIAHGMNAACRNARRLADDAKLLLDAGRYPTAASIAVLSIEESGKKSVLRGLAFAPNKEAQRSAWIGLSVAPQQECGLDTAGSGRKKSERFRFIAACN